MARLLRMLKLSPEPEPTGGGQGEPQQNEPQPQDPPAQQSEPNGNPAQQSGDLAALQSQLAAMSAQNAQYQQAALAAQIAQQATLEAVALGIDVKTIPYVLKMADMSGVKAKKDGTLDVEAIQAAVNKVLEDVPVLKPKQAEQSKGFQQIGAGSSDGNSNQSDELAKIFGNKQ